MPFAPLLQTEITALVLILCMFSRQSPGVVVVGLVAFGSLFVSGLQVLARAALKNLLPCVIPLCVVSILVYIIQCLLLCPCLQATDQESHTITREGHV